MLARVAGERLLGDFSHVLHQRFDFRRGFARRGEDRTVAAGFKVETEDRGFALEVWLEFDPVIQIEVAHACTCVHRDLTATEIVVVTIDDGPGGFIAERPAASIDAEVERGKK